MLNVSNSITHEKVALNLTIGAAIVATRCGVTSRHQVICRYIQVTLLIFKDRSPFLSFVKNIKLKFFLLSL